MRCLLPILAAAAVFLSAARVPAQPSETPPVKRAKPPEKWDRRVLDTFFPDARSALVGPRPKAMDRPAEQAAPPVVDTSADNVAAPAETFAWSRFISADTLQDEVKTIHPLLAAETQSQQKFLGGGFKRSRNILGTLAALFAIIHEYDGEVKWKLRAPAARDSFAQTAASCATASAPAFQEVKLRAEDLAALLRGETTAATQAADPKSQWPKIAPREALMARMELAQRDRIMPWTASAMQFNRSSAALLHEAELVAAVTQIIARDGYDYADDESYQEHARALATAAAELVEAAKTKNYQAARTAATSLTKACNACHADFR